MLAPGGVHGLLKALRHFLEQKNLNASSGVLRRLLSETVDDSHGQFIQRNSSKYNSHLLSSTSDKESSSFSVYHPLVALSIQQGVDAVSSGPSSSSLRPASLSVLAHVAAESKRWVEALTLAAHLPYKPAPAFVSSLVTPMNWRSVNGFQRHRGWEWSVPDALYRLGTAGAWYDALQLALDAESHWKGGSGVGEAYSLSVLIPLVASRSDQWHDAIRLFRSAYSSGALQSSDVCVKVLQACIPARRWEVALHIAADLDRTQQLYNDPNSAALVGSLMRLVPDWRTSLELFSRFRQRCAASHPSQAMLQHVLVSCDRAGAWEAATRVFETVKEDGRLDQLDGTECYTTLMRSFHHAHQWERAFEAVSWMAHASESAAATGYCELLELCETSGQWTAALKLGKQLMFEDGGSEDSRKERLPTSTILSLLFACACGKQWRAALMVYRAHEQIAAPHILAPCAVLQACVHSNAWQEGIVFFNSLQEARPRIILPPLGLNLAMKLCVVNQRWGAALIMLQQMIDEGLPTDNHNQKLGLWAAALCGSWRRSLEHYNRIPIQQRSQEDAVVVRSATRYAGPLATAMVMRHLQSTK